MNETQGPDLVELTSWWEPLVTDRKGQSAVRVTSLVLAGCLLGKSPNLRVLSCPHL